MQCTQPSVGRSRAMPRLGKSLRCVCGAFFVLSQISRGADECLQYPGAACRCSNASHMNI